jgi:hypothetical protein
MIKTVLYIKADTNDADYITSENKILEGDLDTIRKVAAAIKECKEHHNWVMREFCGEQESPHEVYKDILTEEEIEVFNGYTPYGEYGIHSIKEIQIREIKILEDLF